MTETNNGLLIKYVISIIPKLISKTKGLFFIPIITKTLGQEVYGIWTNFNISLTLIASIASLSLGAATNKYLADTSKERFTREYWAITIVTMASAAVISLILLLGHDYIAFIIFASDTRSYLVFILVAALVSSLYSGQSMQFYRSQERIELFSSMQSIKSLGEIGAVVGAALIFESITVTLVSYAVFNSLFSILVLSLFVKEHGVLSPDFRRINQYIQFGIPLVISGTMYWLVNVSDRYLITYFHTIDTTGGYAVVYAAASGLSIFSLAIGTVLFPDLSSLRADSDIEAYRQRLSNVINYYFITTIPAAVGLAVIADPFLRLLSTASISEYTDLMFMLAPAMAAYGLVNILIQALLSDGRSQVSALIWGIIAVLNLGANVILVPRYAAMGASVATLGSFVIGLILVVLWKQNDIRISFVLLGKVLVVSVIMGGIVTLVRLLVPVSGIVALPVLVGTGVFVYVTLGFISGFLTRQDVKFVIDAI